MGLSTVKILKILVATNSKKEILEYINKYLSQSSKFKAQSSGNKTKPLIIVTPNPEQIVLAQKNSHFADVLNWADVAIPDGQGLVWASQFLNPSPITHHPSLIKKRIPGVEFMEDLVWLAAVRGYGIGLIGGRGGVAVKALECLRQKHPGLVGWAMEPGELCADNLGDLDNLGEKIRKTNTRLVFVGLGAPKQEYFIARLTHPSSLIPHHPLVLMSVGGAFDVISGALPRAPHFWQKLGLEWLWRLVRQPWRLVRQLALLKFVFLVFKQKLAPPQAGLI